MDIQQILRAVDHTLLTRTATWAEIRAVCEEGLRYGVASVCIPPCFVAQAAAYLSGRLPVCTVIGFPNGYHTTAVKCFEAEDAVKNGADEFDMVINGGWVKEGRYDDVLSEIRAVKAAGDGRLLKVIVETCQLTEEEKIRLCGVVSNAGADYIKTSTGFAGGGATAEDIALFARHVAPPVKIKAAGGIRTLEDAERFLKLGASRLGTSSIVKLLENRPAAGY